MTAIGSSGLDVFPLALGGNTFGWTSDESESHAVLDAFREAGGNFIDTADAYSAWAPGNAGGESETVIGRWLEGRSDRDELVIATKVGAHPDLKGLAPATVAAAADASLKRLGVEAIDLYYAHYDDLETPIADAVQAFGDLVTAGKVRHLGLSNFSPERLREWLTVSDELSVPRPVALQPHYNLVSREPYESAYAPIAREAGLGVAPYWSLAAGFLTGKYRTTEDFADAARKGSLAGYFSAEGLAVVDELRHIGARLGEQPATVALAWLRSRPEITAPIASARTVEQLPALLAGAVLNLSTEDVRSLDDLSAKVPATV